VFLFGLNFRSQFLNFNLNQQNKHLNKKWLLEKTVGLVALAVRLAANASGGGARRRDFEDEIECLAGA
jgi:hypothetical protein